MSTNAGCPEYTDTPQTWFRLTTLCPGLPGWAGTGRNTDPLTPILIIKHPLDRWIRLLALLWLSSQIAKYNSVIQRKSVKCYRTERLRLTNEQRKMCTVIQGGLVEQGVLGIVIGVVIGND